MLNRRHIRTLVIQSVYSNSIELIESKLNSVLEELKKLMKNNVSGKIEIRL